MPGGSVLRSCETWICTIFAAVPGASSPQRSSMSRSAVTVRLASSASRASSARGLSPPSRTGADPSCTSNGPSRSVTMAMVGDATPALERRTWRSAAPWTGGLPPERGPRSGGRGGGFEDLDAVTTRDRQDLLDVRRRGQRLGVGGGAPPPPPGGGEHPQTPGGGRGEGEG